MDSNATSTAPAPTTTLQFRHLVARSNHFLVARLPKSWIFWFAFPHEIWHYLVARAFGLQARLVPGACLFEPTSRLKRALVLIAPATLGLVFPLLWQLGQQWLAGDIAAMDWGMLALLFVAWWSGCLGDFIDVWLLLGRQENEAQHRARMQRMVARYGPELAYQWQAVRH